MRSFVFPALVSLIILGGTQVPCSAQHMNSVEAPCRDAVATSDVAQCFDRAQRAADQKLNQVYAEIQAALAPVGRRNLQDAERAWLKFRDATCSAERGLYDEGTAASPAYSACLEEETRQRARDLETIYGWKIERVRP